MKASSIGLCMLLMGMTAIATPALAQSDDAKQEISRLWNIESMMRQAADNISRRYNLNEAQREQTHRMLTEEVTKFLDTHDDIWPLIRDLTRFQIQGKAPDGDIARRIGHSALPLLQEIEDAIYSANSRWREILTEDQKKMHDWDLQDMARTFAKMDHNFSEMTKGKAVQQGVFPQPNTEVPQPVQPPKPDPNFKPTVPTAPEREGPLEDWWDSYVEKFIRDHNLDDAQSEAALSILRECKQRARAYRQTKSSEFAQAERRLREAYRPDQPAEARELKLRVWRDILKKLNQPILDLFQELQERLSRIPTDAQKRRAGTLEERPDRKSRTPRESRPSPTAEPKPEATDAPPSKVPAPAPEPKAEGDR